MQTYKTNVIYRHPKSRVECTNCGEIFETDFAENPYTEMCRIALGKFRHCPSCGAKFVGCQVNGIDFNECSIDIQK